MGFVIAKVMVLNPTDDSKSTEVECLVDTGAIYSLLPRNLLEEIGIEPEWERKFRQASGREITRRVGEARFRYDDYEGTSPVVFGREGDRPLLGVVTLEVLGLEVDPISGELRPTTLLLL